MFPVVLSGKHGLIEFRKRERQFTYQWLIHVLFRFGRGFRCYFRCRFNPHLESHEQQRKYTWRSDGALAYTYWSYNPCTIFFCYNSEKEKISTEFRVVNRQQVNPHCSGQSCDFRDVNNTITRLLWGTLEGTRPFAAERVNVIALSTGVYLHEAPTLKAPRPSCCSLRFSAGLTIWTTCITSLWLSSANCAPFCDHYSTGARIRA